MNYRAKMKSKTDTPRYAVAIYIHTSNDKGDKKENKLGGCFTGFLYRTDTPKFMKGIVKSTA